MEIEEQTHFLTGAVTVFCSFFFPLRVFGVLDGSNYSGLLAAGRKKKKKNLKNKCHSAARHENGPCLLQSMDLFHILMHENNNKSHV